MYSRKSSGPTIRDSLRDKASRCVYSRYAARCNATAVCSVPGPPWMTVTAVRRPDDDVLLALDRFDDVGHLAGAGGVECGDQCRLVDHITVRRGISAGAIAGQVLVVDSPYRAVASPDVAPHLHRFGAAGVAR